MAREKQVDSKYIQTASSKSSQPDNGFGNSHYYCSLTFLRGIKGLEKEKFLPKKTELYEATQVGRSVGQFPS